MKSETEIIDSLIAKARENLSYYRKNDKIDAGLFSGWQARALYFLREVVGNHTYLQQFKKLTNKSEDDLKSGIGILVALKEDFESGNIVKKQAGASAISLIKNICDKFSLVCEQMKHRYGNRGALAIADEYDVQDLFHSLLHLHFDDIRPEEWTPSHAGKCSRMDFLLPEDKVVIEIKKTRVGLEAKELGSQLIEDIARYEKHPSCAMLICFVYDPGKFILNPRGIENDLRRSKDLAVEVFIRH